MTLAFYSLTWGFLLWSAETTLISAGFHYTVLIFRADLWARQALLSARLYTVLTGCCTKGAFAFFYMIVVMTSAKRWCPSAKRSRRVWGTEWIWMILFVSCHGGNLEVKVLVQWSIKLWDIFTSWTFSRPDKQLLEELVSGCRCQMKFNYVVSETKGSPTMWGFPQNLLCY